jgi:hypothetical protein
LVAGFLTGTKNLTVKSFSIFFSLPASFRYSQHKSINAGYLALDLQARFWMQVVDELRNGVRLKKISFHHSPTEYEMTPYEILMDDIRSR